jgi:lysozyme family protein
MNFDQAFEKLLGHEGGYSDHPADPGGKTMWGVTEKVARAKGYRGDMRDLPVSFAKESVYRPDYWNAVRAEDLPPALRYATFDAAVNSGPAQAIRWLQRAAGATPDGVFGPQTLLAVKTQNPEALLRRFLSQRLRFMTNLPNWGSFSRGWARRISDLLEA